MPEQKMYNGEVVLSFDPKVHMYTINGEPAPSVTKITGVIDKPALVPWAVNETVAHVERAWKPGKPYSREQIDVVLNDAKSARFRRSGIALTIGSDAHDWIERWIKSVLLGLDPPRQPEYPPVVAAVGSFLSWVEANDVRFVSSERKVCSVKHKYTGTCDIDMYIGDKRVVADLKTSKGIYPEYYIQAAAYASALTEETGVHYDGVAIIRIPKDGKDVEVGISHDIDTLFDVFLSCLKIWRWKKEWKQPHLS